MINSYMLTLIHDIANPLLDFLKDDPVRPEIPRDFRVSGRRFVATILEDNNPQAMVCVSLHDFVPTTVEDLSKDSDQLTTAIFYTIWSYAPGAAGTLILSVVKQIQQQYPTVSRFITLSPKTPMARKFHTKNGAFELQENETTINYEYLING
jgi:hypothetical protein